MTTKNNKNLGKTIIFSTFLFGSLALIISLWTIDFMGSEEVSPSYVRETLAIPTTEGFEMTLEAMPTREHAPGHSGGGGGEHEENAEPTITPTFDVADWVPEEDLSDDLADE